MQTDPTRGPRVQIAVACAVGAALALLLIAVSPARGDTADPPRSGVHACGSHELAAHSWTSSIDGVPRERGSRWIVYWAGRHGSCNFAEQTLAGLLRFSDDFIREAGSPNTFHGARCSWSTGTPGDHEAIAPFREIRCSLAIVLHRHRFATTVGALADPDPRFITPSE
jgi:hypothetical protein